MDDKPIKAEASESAAQEILRQKALEAVALYATRIVENLGRVQKLVNLYFLLKGSKDFSSNSAIDDILRASVVLAHATLEDFLRTLAANLLPEAGEQTLNQIPLAGTSSSGRAEKFHLGRLTKYKGKSIDDVIAESILEHLEHSSYNSAADIASLLQSLGLKVSAVNHHFPLLEELMKRRHLIVHRADCAEPIGTQEQAVQSITPDEVINWTEAVILFIKDIMPETVTRHLLAHGYIKKIAGGIRIQVKNGT